MEKSYIESKEFNNFQNDTRNGDVPLLDSIIIDAKSWGKVDKIISRYYGKDNMHLLPFLLSFNNISDIKEMKVGMMFDIPDMDVLFLNMKVIDTDASVPGVLNTTDNTSLNNTNMKANGSKVTVPKLGVTLKEIEYNKATGVITI
jgi:hypothetical protein